MARALGLTLGGFLAARDRGERLVRDQDGAGLEQITAALRLE